MTNIIDASNRFNKDKKPKTMHIESPVYEIGTGYMVMDISTQLDLISYKNIHYISQGQVGESGEVINLNMLLNICKSIFNSICLPFGGQKVRVMVERENELGEFAVYIHRTDPLTLLRIMRTGDNVNFENDFGFTAEYVSITEDDDEIDIYTEEAHKAWTAREPKFKFDPDSSISSKSIEAIISNMELIARSAGEHGRMAYHPSIGGCQLFSIGIKRSLKRMIVINLSLAKT